MSKQDVPIPPAPAGSVNITLDVLKELIASSTRDQLAALSGKTFDDGMSERMRQMRGQDRPLPPEELIQCRSPITGSTMTARVIMSRQFPAGRIVEVLDYKRPDGSDLHIDDGGKYAGTKRDMIPVQPGEEPNAEQFQYISYLYREFFAKDWNAISGRPGSFLAQWRIAQAEPRAAE